MAYANKGPKRDMVFHSVLVSAGPVRLTVDSEPKWLEKKQNHLVELTLDGNKVVYWCENQRCADFFKGKKGSTFTIVAKGGGKSPEEKESATIELAGGTAPAQQQQAPAASTGGQQRQSSPTPAAWPPERAVGQAKVFIARRVSLMKICAKAAITFAKELAEDKAAPLVLGVQEIEKVMVSLQIAAERAGYADAMPVAITYPGLEPVAHKAESKKPEAKPTYHCTKCGDVAVAKEGDICADCKEIMEQEKAAGQEDDVPF